MGWGLTFLFCRFDHVFFFYYAGVFPIHSSIYHLPRSDERMSNTASQFPLLFSLLLLYVYQNPGEVFG